jgi:uncharacterized protein
LTNSKIKLKIAYGTLGWKIMKFTLNEIKKRAYNEPFIFNKEVDLSELEAMNNDIREIKPVQVQGQCTVDGNEIIFSLTINGEMILPCARTLVDVSYPFEVQEVEVFSTSPHYGQEESENEIFPVEGDVLDLKPCILENVLLAIPFRVFSDDEEALSQAVLKGDGWEFTFEPDEDKVEEQEKTIDPRLKKLQSLLDDNENEK